MKKIIILNGAGRKNGNTAELIKAFTEGAEAAGNEVREFYLQTMNIHGCMNCQGCAREKDTTTVKTDAGEEAGAGDSQTPSQHYQPSVSSASSASCVSYCVQKDDMQQIYDAYVNCDVIVFASPVYWFTITGTLKTAVDRLYALQKSMGLDAIKRDTVFIMTSGAPVEMNPQPIEWYSTFEKMLGWKSLGMILGTGKTAEARKLGESI